MILAELPHLKAALGLLGFDNGSDVNAAASVPPPWEGRLVLADRELAGLSFLEIDALACGEDSERGAVALKAPNAEAALQAAFDDGELVDCFMIPWGGAQ